MSFHPVMSYGAAVIGSTDVVMGDVDR